jgi:hypothetical protein
VSPAALRADPAATSPAITMKEAFEASMNLEQIPRYYPHLRDHAEEQATSSINNSASAPKICVTRTVLRERSGRCRLGRRA